MVGKVVQFTSRCDTIYVDKALGGMCWVRMDSVGIWMACSTTSGSPAIRFISGGYVGS